MKEKLQLLTQEWTSLQTKITTKLTAQAQEKNTLTTQLQESNRKLELQMKENSENEKVLEKLLKEFKELGENL